MRLPGKTSALLSLALLLVPPLAFGAEGALPPAGESFNQKVERLKAMCRLPGDLLPAYRRNPVYISGRCEDAIDSARKEVDATLAIIRSDTAAVTVTAARAVQGAGPAKDSQVESERLFKDAEARKRRRAARQAAQAEFFAKSVKALGEFVQIVRAEARRADRDADTAQPEIQERHLMTSAKLDIYANNLEKIGSEFNKEEAASNQDAATSLAEAQEYQRLANEAKGGANSLGSLGDKIALANVGIQGLGLLQNSKGSQPSAPGSTGSSIAGSTNNLFGDPVVAAAERAMRGDGSDTSFKESDVYSTSAGDYTSKSNISSSSASIAPTKQQMAREALAKRRAAAASGAAAGSGGQSAAAGKDGQTPTSQAAVGSGESVVEYDGAGGVQDLGLAASLGADDFNISDIMNQMLGLGEESPDVGGSASFGGGREAASYGRGGNSQLPEGVLSEDSGTLFERVRSASARSVKGGRVLNGLNSKI